MAAHIEKVGDAALRSELICAVVDEGIGEREVLRRIEAAQTGEKDDEVFSRENTLSDGDGTSSEGGMGGEVFSRENTSGGNGASSSRGRDGAGSSGAPSLRGALRATGDAIERLRRTVLSDEERQKARDGRDALQAMVEELNEILG